MTHDVDHRHHSPHTPAAGPSHAIFLDATCESSCARARKPTSTAGDAGAETAQARVLMQWLDGERRAHPLGARLYRKVYWRMYAGLGSRATEAEDATQATFLEAVKNRASIRKGLSEYVSGIGRMKLREHYRRRGRHERTVSRAELDGLPAEGTDAPTAVELALEVGQLVRALEQLPLTDQRCLALVYGRELRNVDAAAALGLPEVTFNNRIGHARAAAQGASGRHARRRRSQPLVTIVPAMGRVGAEPGRSGRA